MITEHIDDLIHPLDKIHNFPESLPFNPSVMQDINNWVKTEGDRIIFIYGEGDPWSAAQFEVSNLEAIKIINPGTKHETAIDDLNYENYSIVIEKLSEWLDHQDFVF